MLTEIHFHKAKCHTGINVGTAHGYRERPIQGVQEYATYLLVDDSMLSLHSGHGPDPRDNSRLATIILTAKKMGVPKATIERAIAIGQGVLPSGSTLEHVVVEAIMPSSVAVIIECQTDSKNRTLQDLRLLITKAGGSVTPTNHLFERKGRMILRRSGDIGEAEAMDLAIEAGALDVDIITEDGSEEIIVLTEPTQITAISNALAQSPGLEVKSWDIIWDPKEEMMVDVESPKQLNSFLGKACQATYVQ